MASDNELKKISDEGTIISLLQTAKDENSEVFIWRLIGSKKHMARIKLEALRKLRRDFSIVPESGEVELVQDIMGGHNHIDIYIPDSGLLLRCHVKSLDLPNRYYLHLPHHVAQVERRKSLRVKVHETSDVKLNFGKTTSGPKPMSQHFHKICYDISSGGFSFYVSRLESKFFRIHDPVRSIEIKVGSWSGKVNAEVALIKEVEPTEQNGLSYKVWRVCCRFTQIDQISKKYIERFVFERLNEELHVINE